MPYSAIAPVVMVVIVVVVVSAGAVGAYVIVGQVGAPTSSASSISTTGHSLVTMSSTGVQTGLSSTSAASSSSVATSSLSMIESSSSSTAFSCPTSEFSNLTNIAGSSSSSGYVTPAFNPIRLFGNFSSMSVQISESINGSLAFADNSSYTVVGTSTVNNTHLVEVSFTVSFDTLGFGTYSENATAWFAPDGNATMFEQGSQTLTGSMAAQEGSALALTFEAPISVGQAFSAFPSEAFVSLNQTTVNLGSTPLKVTNYGISPSFIQEIQSQCPSMSLGSAAITWQSGTIGGQNLTTYLNFSESAQNAGSFAITVQVVSLTKA